MFYFLFTVSGGFYFAAWRFYSNAQRKNGEGKPIESSLLGLTLSVVLGSVFGTLTGLYPVLSRANGFLEAHRGQQQQIIESKKKELEQLQREIDFEQQRKEIRELREKRLKRYPLKTKEQ